MRVMNFAMNEPTQNKNSFNLRLPPICRDFSNEVMYDPRTLAQSNVPSVSGLDLNNARAGKKHYKAGA